MGLFSSKKKHFVDTQVTRVIEDDLVPDALEGALINSLFTKTSLQTEIYNHALKGGHRQFSRMYRYAERGEYYYGLPDARVLSSSDGLIAARAKLGAVTGRTILSIEYMHFRPLNNYHKGWETLYEDFGYDPETNIVEGIPGWTGNPLYLDKLEAIYGTAPGLEPQISGLGSWDVSSQTGETPLRVPVPENSKNQVVGEDYRIEVNAEEAIEIHLVYRDDVEEAEEGQIQELGEPLNYIYSVALGDDPNNEYYQAKYTYLGPNNEILIGYWTYDPLTETIPELTDIYNQAPTESGTYFPFVVFRSQGVNRGTEADVNTEQYKTSEELLHYLNMDYREIADALADADGIEDVDQAVMMMGVPITSTDEVDVEYLFRYFDNVRAFLPDPAGYKLIEDYGKFLRVDAHYETSLAQGENYALDIRDADFRMTLSFDRITREIVPGTIGAVGTYENTLIDIGTNNPIITEIPEGAATRTGRRFDRQITETLLERIVVIDPQVRFHIAPGLGAEGGADDERLLIPVDYEVSRKMSLMNRETLYYRSLHFVFNSHVVQKIKWYERGFFKALLIVVAVVITILSYGVDGGQTLYAAIVAGTATTAMLISAILNFVVTTLVFELVFTAIVEVIGLEAAQWLAIAAALVGGFKWIQHGKMTVNAANYMKASTGLVKGAGNVLKDAFTDLLDEYAEFELLKEARQDELDEANSLLGNGTYLDPYLLIAEEPLLIIGEPPSSYFERTIHRGNIGVETLNLVQNFVSTSLRLPTMHETTGDSLYD